MERARPQSELMRRSDIAPALPSPVEKTKPIPIFAPRVNTLAQVQEVQDVFAWRAVPNETPGRVLAHMGTEMIELQEAVELGDPQEIGSEIADVILLASRLASLHNIDLNQAVSAKMRRNADKYNPYVIEELREGGMDEQVAMKHVRSQWNRDDDKRYR